MTADQRPRQSGDVAARVHSTRGSLLAPGTLLLCVFVVVSLSPALGASPAEHYTRGNAAYEAGDFLTAVAEYDSAAALILHPDILYNRGNAWFKLGQVGRAIADYSRAWVLNPSDPAPLQNLEFCRAFRPDKTTVLVNPLVKVLTGFLRLISLGLARLLAGVFFLLALAALGLMLVRANRAWAWIAAGLGVFCLYSFLSWMSWNHVVSPNRGVVVVPEVTLRSGPGEDYRDMVMVHDGLEVSVREQRGDWVLVQAPGGAGGWCRTDAVEQIFPPR